MKAKTIWIVVKDTFVDTAIDGPLKAFLTRREAVDFIAEYNESGWGPTISSPPIPFTKRPTSAKK